MQWRYEPSATGALLRLGAMMLLWLPLTLGQLISRAWGWEWDDEEERP